MSRPCAALLSLLCLPAAAGIVPSARADGYLAYSGTASDLRTHRFLYGEQHVLLDRGGRTAQRVVLYTCRNGAPFARKTVSYVEPFAPDFMLEDASNGLEEGVRGAAGAREVFFRPGQDGAVKQASLPRVPDLVADAGFDEFVRANWAELTADRDLTLHFLVPSRLNDMGFHIEALRGDNIDGEPVAVFRLKLSGFFGWFLPGIDVYYGTRNHVLMRYVGLSDLRDADGDNYKVVVSFDPKDRRPAGLEAFDRAERAHLAPCT